MRTPAILTTMGVHYGMDDYKYSNLVMVSSLLFLIPAVFFAINGDYLTSMCVTIACVFSVLGDSVLIEKQIVAVRTYDIISASLMFLIIVARHFAIHKNPDITILAKVILPLALFKYSSLATPQNEWEIRHSLWHVIVVIILLSEV